jgi:hypothetical protein
MEAIPPHLQKGLIISITAIEADDEEIYKAEPNS